jgi:hypothetical protein
LFEAHKFFMGIELRESEFPMDSILSSKDTAVLPKKTPNEIHIAGAQGNDGKTIPSSTPISDPTEVLWKNSEASSSLHAQYHAAKLAVCALSRTINTLVDGQAAIGKEAVKEAYSFSIKCMDNKTEAAILSGWEEASLPQNANPYCQPLKMLIDKKNNIIQSRISIWARVFEFAHGAGIKPESFLGYVDRNSGMRNWYNAIVADERKKKAANDNEPDTKPINAGGGDEGDTKDDNGDSNDTEKPFNSLEISFAERIHGIDNLGLVAFDIDTLMFNSAAMDALRQIPGYGGVVEASTGKCRSFIDDNDQHLTGKEGS